MVKKELAIRAELTSSGAANQAWLRPDCGIPFNFDKNRFILNKRAS